LIFVRRLSDVTLGTLRILMTVRGRKLPAALNGFVEVTIFVVAISQVVRNATNFWSVLGYASGFAAGTVAPGERQRVRAQRDRALSAQCRLPGVLRSVRRLRAWFHRFLLVGGVGVGVYGK